MNNEPINKLIILDEQFEKIEGHFYEYDKSVVEIFKQQGYETIIYGHQNMLKVFGDELNARPWFTINAKSKIRKIPIVGAIFYRIGFWEKYKKEIKCILTENTGKNENCLFFFPNVYWYNILPIAKALKDINANAALLFRVSIYDTVGLPKKILPVTMAIIKYAEKILKNKPNVHFFSDSEVIAIEWLAHFNSEMKVLPIPHLTLNKKDTKPAAGDKIRMYLPGGMRLEKGAQLLTEAFVILAKQPEVLDRIILVTQFLGNDSVLDGYKNRLTALPVENHFLQHLTTEEYNHQLTIADVILIPYLVSEGYRARTSGILAEAIASSKPFITTDGTWMSLQARKYNTGLIIPDGQPAALAEAIASMVTAYSDYSKKADAACNQWMADQSKDVFYRQLSSALL